jgi:hypothetical protein
MESQNEKEIERRIANGRYLLVLSEPGFFWSRIWRRHPTV